MFNHLKTKQIRIRFYFQSQIEVFHCPDVLKLKYRVYFLLFQVYVQSLKKKFCHLESNPPYVRFDPWYVKFDKDIYPWFDFYSLLTRFLRHHYFLVLSWTCTTSLKMLCLCGKVTSTSIVGGKAFNDYATLSRFNRFLVKYLKYAHEGARRL